MAFLFVMLGYSFFKGRRMIRYVDISFNEYKKVYRQGEKFELIIEVPKQRIFETREIIVEVQYTSIMERKTQKVRESLLLQRRTDGKVVLEHELKQCDCLEIEINEFYLKDLCGCFQFKKNVDFYEKILVLPKEYSIENGEISDAVEEYGNVRLTGTKKQEDKTEPMLYLDLNSLMYEQDLSIRTCFLLVVYAVSSTLLKHRYCHRLLFGMEQFVVEDWEDYLPVFGRIFDLLRADRLLERPKDMSMITHVITTGKGLPLPSYYRKAIAVIRDENSIQREFAMTEYVRAKNLQEDNFYLSL